MGAEEEQTRKELKNLEESSLHPQNEIQTSSERAQRHGNPRPASGKDACRGHGPAMVCGSGSPCGGGRD